MHLQRSCRCINIPLKVKPVARIFILEELSSILAEVNFGGTGFDCDENINFQKLSGIIITIVYHYWNYQCWRKLI